MLLTLLPTLGVGTQRWDESLLLPDVQGLKVPRPILNLGLPRSATTSILDFFSCSGMSTSHYHCKMTTAGVTPFENATQVAATCRKKDVCRCQIFGECVAPLVPEVSDRFPLHHPDHYCKVYGLCDSDAHDKLPEHLVPSGWKRKGVYTAAHDPTFCGNCLRDNIIEEQSPLAGCGDFHVWAQMDGPWRDGQCFLPQLWALNRIHDAYPNATLLLPTRKPDQWVKAMSQGNGSEWLGPLRGYFRACNLPTCGPACVNSDGQFAKFYEEHSETIRNFVMKYPSHKLIEIDAEDDHAGAKLAAATGLDATCWGEKKCRASCSFWRDLQKQKAEEAACAKDPARVGCPRALPVHAPSAPAKEGYHKVPAPRGDVNKNVSPNAPASRDSKVRAASNVPDVASAGAEIAAANAAAAKEMVDATKAASDKAIAALPKEKELKEAVAKDTSIIQDVRFSRSEAAPESEWLSPDAIRERMAEPSVIAPVH